MKRIPLLILAIALASCKTAADTQRLGSLVNLAIAVAEKRGAISSQDAADIRAAETIILPPNLPATGK